MNPPAALQGAMGRERKPFTYTPGGLNLSEIKSERMAKRLMRNAMNEGVPQMPVQNIQSPTTPTAPLNVPNFNCLPVQVFPTFSLPANPKSLLRTRSTTSQPRDPPSAFYQQNSSSTLPSTGSAKYRQNNDIQNQGVVNNSGVNRGSSLYTQMPSYINPAPQNDVNVQEKYSPYQFDTFKPGNDAVFMDTCGDKGQQPAPMYSYINNPVQNQDTVTKRVVPPFQHNPAPQSIDELRADINANVDMHSKYSSLPSYINSSVSDTNSMTKKPSNLYEFNAISNNSSQESYKTTESDGDQPNTLCSNFPSYINPKGESGTLKEPASVLSNSVSVQGNKDASEVQRLQEKYMFDDEEDPMINERLYIDENKKPRKVSFELKEAEASVYVQPIDKRITSMTVPKNLVLNADSHVSGDCIHLDNESKESESSVLIQPIEDSSTPHTLKFQDDTTDDQSEVRVVKKVKKEKQTEETKQAENDDEAETALTVKLPAKKSAAKTETKVEVKQKVLPDGTIEEIKKTITKTTIDGRTEISTRTETRTIPKDEQDEEEVEEEEEEEEEINNGEVVIKEVQENGKEPQKKMTNGQAMIVKKEEKSETTTTKKVVVVQNNAKEEDEEEHEEEEEEEIEEIPEKIEQKPIEVKPQPPSSKPPPIPVEVESEEEEVVEEEEEGQVVEETVHLKKQVSFESNVNEEKSEDTQAKVDEKKVEVTEDKEKEDVQEEEEEEYEEAEERLVEKEVNVETKSEPQSKPEPTREDEEEYTEEEVESEDEVSKKATTVDTKDLKEPPKQEEPKSEPKPEPKEEPAPTTAPEPQKVEAPQKPIEIPIHLDKVEDFEIKPIGPQESISKTEKTEITTSKDCDGNAISTKTEMHRTENVVVSNRVTKTLDQSYEQLTQGLPTMKSYFAPSRERVDISPAKAYQPTYQQPEPTTERRHSLLLERLSMERQVPSPGQYQNQTYQSYNNQSYETRRDLSQEPQSEVVNVSNVKPSTITKNQQWYQNKDENAIYNNVSQTAAPQQWSQPSPQPQYQAPAPPQPQYQAPAQHIYQTQHQPSQPMPQTQTYSDTYSQNYSKDTQSTYQQNSYPSYAPQPTPWGSNNVDSSVTSNQYAYKSQDQNSTQQQYSSSYVPPPWEQDASYVAPPTNTKYFQPPPLANEFQTNSSVPGWKPPPPATGKFSKPAPKAYVPPAPNQSFVKPVTVSEPPKNLPGRKTYYSEYERRYISVPESTYVPAETRYQQQPDPSPQYYYDNDEVPEKVEPEWRRELREFTEKTSQTYSSDKGTQSQYQSQTQTQYQTEQGTQSQYQNQYQTETSARPPWESDAQYAKTPVNYTPTPTWSQTLRPNSGRERTFESDYVSQTKTLGRNRPLSYVESNSNPLPGRTRGVSVDRYNPSSYRSPIPMEHSPVQSHTLNPATAPPPKIYHNPSMPAYHSRASAEPREQPAPYPQPRHWAERASPLQSRSFKYLQWITGTDE